MEEIMDSQIYCGTVPVIRTLNGHAVSHPRAQLHFEVDPNHIDEARWAVSFSVPNKNNSGRFERFFAKAVKDDFLAEGMANTLVGIDEKNTELSSMLDANGRAMGVDDLVTVWLNRSSRKREYLGRLEEIGYESLPFPMTEREAARRNEEDPTMPQKSIEAVEKDLEHLIGVRNEIVELARRDRAIVDTVLQKYLATIRLQPAEDDLERVLDELMRNVNESAEIVCLEPLNQADRLWGTRTTKETALRALIDLDTIMQALDPSNEGRAVVNGDSYACFPPVQTPSSLNDAGEYLEYCVGTGLIGAKVQRKKGEARWVLFVVERKTLIGVLATREEAEELNTIQSILKAAHAI
jgi:hypothetical protein